jgi:hypothetical protein
MDPIMMVKKKKKSCFKRDWIDRIVYVAKPLNLNLVNKVDDSKFVALVFTY